MAGGENATVLEVGAVFGCGEVHFDVVEVFTLAEVVVIGGGEKASAVASHDRLQVSAVDVERERLESVHSSFFSGVEIFSDLGDPIGREI